MQQNLIRSNKKISFNVIWKVFGAVLFAYLFFGFMVFPCFNTLKSIFTAKNQAGETDPLLIIRLLRAGKMMEPIWNSVKLAICMTVTVNIVGISIVLLTEYFDIKGAKILRLGYMTTLIYSGIALVTGYQYLYDKDGLITKWLFSNIPGININEKWFTGFYAVLFTMTFACTSNHALFLRNAIRGIDYNTVEAARNMGAKPFKVLFRVVMPTLLPTLFSLTVMTFITGLCAMSAPTILGYNSINPQIIELAGTLEADGDFGQERAALLSIILAIFSITLLLILNHFERKGHYLSVSKTKAKIVKQKIQNPVANVFAHIYAYILFIIYSMPVVTIIIFAFQKYEMVDARKLDLSSWTFVNFYGTETRYLTKNKGKKVIQIPFENAVSGQFSHQKTADGIVLSFVLSAIAAALACIIVLIAVNYIFENKNQKRSKIVEACLLFPWLLPTILICYSYRIYFNNNVWWLFGQNLYLKNNVRILLIMAYTVVKLPFSIRMTKAAFYAIDEELEDAARNLGANPIITFLRIKLPIILPSVLAVFALNFNALFSEYDMSATFPRGEVNTYAKIIKTMTAEEEKTGVMNANALARRNASTVFIMIVSGLILYLVYGVGARDLGERLTIRAKRRERLQKIGKALHIGGKEKKIGKDS